MEKKPLPATPTSSRISWSRTAMGPAGRGQSGPLVGCRRSRNHRVALTGSTSRGGTAPATRLARTAIGRAAGPAPRKPPKMADRGPAFYAALFRGFSTPPRKFPRGSTTSQPTWKIRPLARAVATPRGDRPAFPKFFRLQIFFFFNVICVVL